MCFSAFVDDLDRSQVVGTRVLFLILAIRFVHAFDACTFKHVGNPHNTLQGGQGDNGFIDIPAWATETMFVANQSVSFLEAVTRANSRTDRKQKFSLTVSFNKPHPPYLVARPYWDQLAGTRGGHTSMIRIKQRLESHPPWPLDGRYPHGKSGSQIRARSVNCAFLKRPLCGANAEMMNPGLVLLV